MSCFSSMRCPREVLFILAPLLLMACSRAQQAPPPADHDQGRALYQLIHSQVKPGMSSAQVQAILGPGTRPEDPVRIRRATSAFASKLPAAYPDGVGPNDLFLGYTAGDHGILFQFRDDQLVNFSANDYASYRPIKNEGTNP